MIRIIICCYNGLFGYRLTSIELMLWNMNDNKTKKNCAFRTHHFELFAMTLCSFSKYLAKLSLMF